MRAAVRFLSSVPNALKKSWRSVIGTMSPKPGSSVVFADLRVALVAIGVGIVNCGQVVN